MGGGIGSRGVARLALAGLALLSSMSGGCASGNDVLDLRVNDQLYRAPRYRARLPVDRAVFVVPIADLRDQRPADASAPIWPRRPMPEELWARPVPEMIDDLLRDALLRSELVTAIDDAVPPKAETLLVTPRLLDLRGFLEEQPTGRCTLATLALQIIVLGPAATDGTRATLFDRSYEQSVGTQVSRAPLPIPELYGRMLHDALARALAELDRSNVTRSGLPLVDLSAPQAKPTAPQAK